MLDPISEIAFGTPAPDVEKPAGVGAVVAFWEPLDANSENEFTSVRFGFDHGSFNYTAEMKLDPDNKRVHLSMSPEVAHLLSASLFDGALGFRAMLEEQEGALDHLGVAHTKALIMFMMQMHELLDDSLEDDK